MSAGEPPIRLECADIRIAVESPDQPEVIALIAELDVLQTALYPPESNHLLDIASLAGANVVFAVARGSTGQAIGCAALVVKPGFSELKRLFVQPAQRKRGTARDLLEFLESAALRAGSLCVMLETGIHQPEAIALYRRAGYTLRGPFGDYGHDPLCVFMEKRLDAAPRLSLPIGE